MFSKTQHAYIIYIDTNINYTSTKYEANPNL